MTNIENTCTAAGSYGRTRINLETSRFTWTIENFSRCPCDIDDSITSPLFETGTRDVITWYLALYPKGSTDDKDGIGIFLHKFNPAGKHHAIFTISILNANGNHCFSNKTEHLFSSTESVGFGCPSFVSKRELWRKKETFLPKDTLTVTCVVRATTSVSSVKLPPKIPNKMTETTEMKLREFQHLSSDFKTFYESGRHNDFSLKVGSHKLPVHKAILSARSTVFAAMFTDDMLEKNENCAVINDIPIDVMQSLLVYLYSGQLENLTQELAVSLFAAAEKYAILDLKERCRRYLLFHLSVDNVCKVLHLACLFNDSLLKKDSEVFLRSNAASVQQTAGWLELMKENPDLAFEMLKIVDKEV